MPPVRGLFFALIKEQSLLWWINSNLLPPIESASHSKLPVSDKEYWDVPIGWDLRFNLSCYCFCALLGWDIVCVKGELKSGKTQIQQIFTKTICSFHVNFGESGDIKSYKYPHGFIWSKHNKDRGIQSGVFREREIERSSLHTIWEQM